MVASETESDTSINAEEAGDSRPARDKGTDSHRIPSFDNAITDPNIPLGPLFASVVTAIVMAIMRETNSAMILSDKASRLCKQTGNPNPGPARATQVPLRQLVERALIRPLRILFLSPIVFLIGLYKALVFGMTYLLFATLPSVFEETYGWGIGISGLADLAIGSGCAIGLFTFARVECSVSARIARLWE
ncbi:hypothetical protein F4776DRAFT_669395 [Hypoxylon sp. NC0597]|nr:hypothetical protein F4776DRAFT_669395 [Hypoxylon sp. NC0597]